MFRKITARAQFLIASAMLACGLGAVSYGQGFLWTYPFAGVQPQQTMNFSNPPISIGPQGIVVGSTSEVSNVPIGSVAYTSFGNATTYAAATSLYVTSLSVPYNMTVTNCNVLAGGTVGTNAIICYLFNSAGTVIANSALAGTATSGGNTFQTLALTTPLAIQGPSGYFVGVIANGTTDNVRTIAASTFVGRRAGIVTGQTFGTAANITVPATFTANTGPIVYLN